MPQNIASKFNELNQKPTQQEESLPQSGGKFQYPSGKKNNRQ